MREYTTEKLYNINEEPQSIKEYYKDGILMDILRYAYDPRLKFDLPEGVPFTNPAEDGMNREGFSDYAIVHEVRRFNIFCREDIKKIRKELIYTQIYEGLPTQEQPIFIAIKDQTLGELFPNITYELLKEHNVIVD